MIEVRIEGPGKNALGSGVMASLLAQIKAAKGAPLLLTGAGDAFSAGLDLKEVAELDGPGMEKFLRLLTDVTEALFAYPGPTVALVNGHAIAGGCVLALCCDWRVGAANPKARIGLNEVAIGLRFPGRILRVLRYQLAGLERVVLDAGLFDPAEALRRGMLDEVSDDATTLARTRLEARAKHPADAYAAAKVDLRGGLLNVDPEEERAFLREVIPVWTSPEVKARIRAVLKR